jgi:hypothetical protein
MRSSDMFTPIELVSQAYAGLCNGRAPAALDQNQRIEITYDPTGLIREALPSRCVVLRQNILFLGLHLLGAHRWGVVILQKACKIALAACRVTCTACDRMTKPSFEVVASI